jgi:hypothetical protein
MFACSLWFALLAERLWRVERCIAPVEHPGYYPGFCSSGLRL